MYIGSNSSQGNIVWLKGWSLGCYNDDDDDESSDDDKEEDEALKEEEEHLALADSVVTPVVDLVPSFEEIEPFETDESAATPPPPAYSTTARMSIRAQTPIPFLPEIEVDRLLAISTPPSSPLISLSPPSAKERLARCLAAPAHPSSALPIVPHLYGSPNHVRAPRGFRAAMGRLKASSPSTHHPLHPSPPLPPLPSSLYLPPHIPTSLPLPSPPLPPLLASLFIPSPVDHREDNLEVGLPPHKRLYLTALTLGYELGESSTATARPTGDPTEVVEEIAPTTLEGVNARVTELIEVHEEETQDIYAVIEDAQDRQTRLSHKFDVLIDDRSFHQETMLLMEQEALVSQEAWAQLVGLSLAFHQELRAYRTHTQIQDYRIASHEALTATLVAQVSFLQGQLSAALGQTKALQARDSTHADDPKGADSYA
ncbi:hypothetical protein Tco_1326928 [Tanacetum coccineum]